MSLKGYASQLKISGVHENEFATVEHIRREQQGLSVLAHQFVRLIGSDAAEAASAQRDIKATGHAAQKGDVIRVTSGTHSGRETKVRSVATDNIYLVDDITLANTDTFEIYRHKYPTVDSTGKVETTASIAGSVQYDLNGVDTEVHQDTATPANSKPLPIQYLNSVGVRTDLATQTTLAALLTELQLKADLSETQPISAASLPLPALAATSTKQSDGSQKTQIVDSAGDIADVIELSTVPVAANKGLLTQSIIHGLNSAGGGSYVDVKVSPSGKLLVTSDIDQTTPGTTNGVVVNSSALPTGAATQTTLAALLTELQLKADLTENQPVALKDGSGNSVTSEVSGSKQALNVIDVGLNVIDFLDTTEVLDTSSSNIEASGTAIGSCATRVASLAANCSKIKVNDTTGEFIGIYDDSVLVAIIGPGDDQEIPVRIASGSVIKLRNMANAAISTGKLCLQFLG